MTGEGCRICKRKKKDSLVVRFEGFTAVFWRLRYSDKLCYVVGYIRPDISNDRNASYSASSSIRRALAQTVLGLL